MNLLTACPCTSKQNVTAQARQQSFGCKRACSENPALQAAIQHERTTLEGFARAVKT